MHADTEYPPFTEHMRKAFGPNWCVAHRASGKTAKYDAVVTPTRYAREHAAWVAGHPAMQLAESLPVSSETRLICKAVQRYLGG